jgi:hypothetical protein
MKIYLLATATLILFFFAGVGLYSMFQTLTFY